MSKKVTTKTNTAEAINGLCCCGRCNGKAKFPDPFWNYGIYLLIRLDDPKRTTPRKPKKTGGADGNNA